MSRVRWWPRLLTLSGFLLAFEVGSLVGHEGYHELIDSLSKLVEKNPVDPRRHFDLAEALGLHGDLELALQHLDRVDALAGGKFLTDFVRGESFLKAGDFAHAKDALDRTLAAHPESARARVLRAQAERELGQHEASLADYREALKRTASPEPDIIQEVASALSAAGQKTEAAEVLSGGIERLGPIPSLVFRALDLEIEMKNFEGALRRIEQARRNAPRPEPWMARRAAVLAQAGRIEESRAAYKALLAHLDALPLQERNSRAMSQIKEETSAAMDALNSSSRAQ